MRELFKKLHLWLSVPFGLIITLICFSGAILVFESDIMRVIHRNMYHVEKCEGTPLPADRIAGIVAATLPSGVQMTGVTIFTEPDLCYQVNLSQPRRASVFVDQYSGEIKGRNERTPFFDTMFRLHRWLLDSRPTGEGIAWGRTIVGISTLLFVFILVSGIVIWWPRTRKALKNRLSIKTTLGWRRFWYDLHVAGGMYALVVLLALALTGLTWSFSWYRAGFYKVFGVEMAENGQKSQGVNAGGNGGKKGRGEAGGRMEHGIHRQENVDVRESVNQTAVWENAYRRLVRQYPSCESITVSDGEASVALGGYGNRRASDLYRFDKDSGRLTEIKLYKDTDTSGKIRGWIYSVHVGSWGGWATRILTFLASLLGASLPLTGYYLWIKRLYGKKRSRR